MMVCCCNVPFPHSVTISQSYTISVTYKTFVSKYYTSPMYYQVFDASLDSISSSVDGLEVPSSDFSKSFSFDLTEYIKDAFAHYDTTFYNRNRSNYIWSPYGTGHIESYLIYPINMDTGELKDLSPFTFKVGFLITFEKYFSTDSYAYGFKPNFLRLPDHHITLPNLGSYVSEIFDSLNLYFDTEFSLLVHK